MSLMGTLAKVAIGYAAARGVDRMSGGQGLAGLFGGATVPPGEAKTGQAPGMAEMQDMLSQMSGATGMAAMQDMLASFMGKGGLDLSALMGGDGGDKGGLLSSQDKNSAGLAGVFAALGGVTGSGGAGAMLDQVMSQSAPPQAEESAGLMLRAMIQAAKADGRIDETEQAHILELLGDDADADDIAFVKAQLAAPVDAAALAADTPPPLAMQVYAMSLMPIRVDSEGEASYLDQLASELRLTQEAVNTLHLQMGVKPLYG